MAKPILFYISHGHGTGSDRGAVSGSFVELELNQKVAKACYNYLLKQPRESRNWTVTYKERLVKGYSLAQQAEQIRDLQDEKRTVSVDIHFNAGGGDGAEVWVTSDAGERKKLGTELGEKILNQFEKVGQNSRGVKYSDDLYFINNPKKGIAVIVECGFLDNKTDRKGFNTDKKLKAYGEAIAKGMIAYAKNHGG